MQSHHAFKYNGLRAKLTEVHGFNHIFSFHFSELLLFSLLTHPGLRGGMIQRAYRALDMILKSSPLEQHSGGSGGDGTGVMESQHAPRCDCRHTHRRS